MSDPPQRTFAATNHSAEPRRSGRLSVVLASIALVLMGLAGACTGGDSGEADDADGDTLALDEPARRYSAEWLIDTSAVDPQLPMPTLYREVVDDLSGSYLVETPNHLALQTTEEVTLCAAISREPLDPYCASSNRADGSPYVLSYPIQVLRRDWSPSSLYQLAGYRELSLVANTEPDAWSVTTNVTTRGVPVECYLVIGETTAADPGFEICFTDDDLHLLASVDLQSDLVFEIDLVRYERTSITDDFTTGLEDFYEARPNLQEQLLELYPEIPAPRPTPTPDLG